MVFKLKMNLLSTGGMDSGEQHLLVTPSPTTVSSIDPKLLLIQSPKENDTADTNGSEQPLSSLPAPVDSETPAWLFSMSCDTSLCVGSETRL